MKGSSLVTKMTMKIIAITTAQNKSLLKLDLIFGISSEA
jgi:hypothetical protein